VAEHPALELTRRMYKAARRGDWAAVAELHAEREPTLSSPFGAAELWQLKQIRRMDEETVCLAEDAREEAGRKIATLQRGREAVNIYSGEAAQAGETDDGGR
jgi:hypothetical protein